MKKLIISAILALNLCADTCTIYADNIAPLVETEIAYLGNGLRTKFCANYNLTISYLIAAQNVCRNSNPTVFRQMDYLYEQMIQHRSKCSN